MGLFLVNREVAKSYVFGAFRLTVISFFFIVKIVLLRWSRFRDLTLVAVSGSYAGPGFGVLRWSLFRGLTLVSFFYVCESDKIFY